MADAKPTPGPWFWHLGRICSNGCGFGNVLFARTVGADGRYPATKPPSTPVVELPNGGVDGPDGCLIIAAPELLEALEWVVNAESEADRRGVLVNMPEALRRARAAIAKATGGAS